MAKILAPGYLRRKVGTAKSGFRRTLRRARRPGEGGERTGGCFACSFDLADDYLGRGAEKRLTNCLVERKCPALPPRESGVWPVSERGAPVRALKISGRLLPRVHLEDSNAQTLRVEHRIACNGVCEQCGGRLWSASVRSRDGPERLTGEWNCAPPNSVRRAVAHGLASGIVAPQISTAHRGASVKPAACLPAARARGSRTGGLVSKAAARSIAADGPHQCCTRQAAWMQNGSDP
jgi:hypothetical protein